MPGSDKHLENMMDKAKEISDDENPVKGYSWPCGCRILGVPPNVARLIFCSQHRYLGEQLWKTAPHSAKKILDYWDVMPYGKTSAP